jgi:mono/diheme cytochrome c family protein
MLASIVGLAESKQPTKSANARRGDLVFHRRCEGCHNKQAGDTSPFGPPNLHGILKGHDAITPAAAAKIIKNGKGGMPSFETMLSPAQINDVVVYLRTQ